MSKRTDTHRPGAINPTEYRFRCLYSRATTMDGWPVPPIGIDRVIEIQNEPRTGTMYGCIGKCGICGAHYIEGELWSHDPQGTGDTTGDLVHVGRDCAAKYDMVASMIDEGAYTAEREQVRRVTAAEVLRARAREERQEFLDAHPGLAEDLGLLDHPIIRDVAEKFHRTHSLSDKQVALVTKIANEIRNPAAAEVHVPAPVGKGVSFEGEIVSVKLSEGGQYGDVWRMTVKVVTDAGSWLAWGTCPASLLREVREVTDLRGRRVKIKSTLNPGRDAHFSLLQRPRATLVPVEPADICTATAHCTCGLDSTTDRDHATSCALVTAASVATDSQGVSDAPQESEGQPEYHSNAYSYMR